MRSNPLYQVRFVRTLLALFLCTLLFIGCAPGPVLTETNVDTWKFELWYSAPCAKPGENVTARATLTNTDLQMHSIELKDHPVIDLVIGGQESGPSRWSEGKPLQDVSKVVLGPGQSKEIETSWRISPNARASAATAYFYFHPQMLDHPATLALPIPGGCNSSTRPSHERHADNESKKRRTDALDIRSCSHSASQIWQVLTGFDGRGYCNAVTNPVGKIRQVPPSCDVLLVSARVQGIRPNAFAARRR